MLLVAPDDKTVLNTFDLIRQLKRHTDTVRQAEGGQICMEHVWASPPDSIAYDICLEHKKEASLNDQYITHHLNLFKPECAESLAWMSDNFSLQNLKQSDFVWPECMFGALTIYLNGPAFSFSSLSNFDKELKQAVWKENQDSMAKFGGIIHEETINTVLGYLERYQILCEKRDLENNLVFPLQSPSSLSPNASSVNPATPYVGLIDETRWDTTRKKAISKI